VVRSRDPSYAEALRGGLPFKANAGKMLGTSYLYKQTGCGGSHRNPSYSEGRMGGFWSTPDLTKA
jgi:hypothetical protein